MLNKLKEIGALMRQQDSDCTAQPVWEVERKRIVTGIDTDYCEGSNKIVWLIEDEMIFDGDDEFNKLEEAFNSDGAVPDYYRRTGFHVEWVHVTTFFTAKACEEFIAKHGHKYDGQLRFSIESLHRNEELELIRQYLISLPDPERGLTGTSIPVEHEDMEELKGWGMGLSNIQERCVFCDLETRYWHRPMNEPVCPCCAASRKVSEIKAARTARDSKEDK